MKVLRIVGVVSVLTWLAPGAPAGAGGSEAAVPIGPGADFTVMSKTTTHDRLALDTTGPVEIRFSEVHIAPGGTTGPLAQPGVLVVSVDAGSATLAVAGGGTGCASRVIEGGSGAIEAGEGVSAIANRGSTPLTLHLTSITPKGAVAAAAASCPATTEQGVRVTPIHTSTIDPPMSASTSGVSDVYVGRVRAEPGRSAGPWHVHSAPVFVAVNRSEATVKLAHGGHCEVLEVPAGGGTLEVPGMVHEASNRTGEPLTFYVLGFAPSPQPLLRPAPAPEECRSA